MSRTALSGVLLLAAGAASAAPGLASVPSQVAHAPVVASPNASLTTIALKQPRTLINWSSFNIAQGQQVDFLFQNNSGIVLNRVAGLAQIDGKLLGCITTCGPGGAIGGNVWIYSPSGVIFGSHAQVNVGGLLATTAPLLSDQDFLNASNLNFKFGGGSANAGVLVQSGAQISARDSIALVAPWVTTEAGSNLTAGGEALYGAAQNYVVHFDESAGAGLSLIDFEVPASALSDGSTSSAPLTIAGDTAAGRLVISSVSRPSVLSAVISVSGVNTATAATDAGGGDILLLASGGPTAVNVTGQLNASRSVSVQAPDGGLIHVGGSLAASAAGVGGSITVGGAGAAMVDLSAGSRLDASSTGAGQAGGAVTVTANTVLADGAVDAAGATHGGTILIGGGAQGRDAAVANASWTDVGADATFDASATANGAGGQVVIWSDKTTQFDGSILAKGGASAGAGGSAEVSSGGQLGFNGHVDLRAADGTAGQLLLDPSELIVVPTGGSGTVSSGGVNPPATSASSTIGADTIGAALLTSDVTISTHSSVTGGDGVIEFNGGAGPIVFNNTGSTLRTLTFDPENGFLFTTSLIAKGQLNLNLNAGTAPITVPTGESISVLNGGLTLSGSNLTLQGNLAGDSVSLNASGTITQTGGIIATSLLTGASGGSTSLNDANATNGVSNFTSGGNLSITTFADANFTNLSAAGVLSLTDSGGALFANNVSGGSSLAVNAAGSVYLTGNVTSPSISLISGDAINQLAGIVTANTLGASAQNGIVLLDSNVIANLGALLNTSSGGVAVSNASSPLDLTGDIFAPGQPVKLTAGGSITQTGGVITAGPLTALSGSGGLLLADGNAVTSIAALASFGSGGITFVNTGDFAITGDIAAPGQSLFLTSGGAITQAPVSVITANVLMVSAANGVSLPGENEIPLVMSLSNSGAGGISFNDNQSVMFSSVTLGGGDISLSTDSGDLTLQSAVNSPGALFLSAPRAISGTSISSVGDTTITATDSVYGTVTLQSASTGGNYSITGLTMNAGALQPTFTGSAGNLTVSFIGSGETDISNIPLSAPNGSVSVSANGGLTFSGITAGTSITLTSQGDLTQSESDFGITAQSLTASAVTGINLQNFNSVANVVSLTNSQSGSISFFDGSAVTIGAVAQGGNGPISLYAEGDLTLTSALNTASSVYLQSYNGNLTVDGINAGSGATLSASGALAETAGAVISVGGDYSATAMTMNAAAEQPVFTSNAGGLSLNFTQTGGTTDLTGVPLTAPGTVSVTSSQNLTVDSITSSLGGVSLSASGMVAAAPGAQINLVGDYDLTASTVNLPNPSNPTSPLPPPNPAIVQPTFGTGSFGSLFLTFTQSGGTINLTGVPLSATGAVDVSADNAGLTVDAINAGSYIQLYSPNALTTVGASVGSSAYFTGNGSITVASIVANNGGITLNSSGVIGASPSATFKTTSDYNLTASTVSLTNPDIVEPVFTSGFGSLSLTLNQSGGTIDFTGVPLSAPDSITITAGAGVALTLDAMAAGQSVNVNPTYPNTLASLTIVGPVSATAGTVNLTTANYFGAGGGPITTGAITAGGDVNVSAGYDMAVAVATGVINAGGSVNLQSGVDSTGTLTVNSITAGGDVTIQSGGALSSMDGAPVNLGGSYTAQGFTVSSALYQPTFTSGSGSLSLTVTTSNGLDLTGFPLTASGGSVSVNAPNGPLTVDSITAAGDITLYAPNGAVNPIASGGPAIMTLGGLYSVTGDTIAPALFQPSFSSEVSGDISLTFTGAGGVIMTGFALNTPGGSILISAPGENLTTDSLAAAGNVTLDSGGTLDAASGAVITVGGDYSATGSVINPNALQPTLTGSGSSLSLTFTGGAGADLTGHALIAPGSVSVLAPSENLTVDSITAGGDITLDSGGVLTGVSGVNMALFGDYSATGNTISANLLQPNFRLGAFGGISLTFNDSTAPTNLTGSQLFAAGTISIDVPNQSLTVDSLNSSTGGITLTTGGTLFAASGATFTLAGNYFVQAGAIDVTNPTTVQPTFAGGSTGSLTLDYTASTGSIDLTGFPLAAPQGIFVSTEGANLTLDALTTPNGPVQVSTVFESFPSGSLTVVGPIVAGDVSLTTDGAALSAGSITSGGSVSATTGFDAPLTVGAVSAVGSINLQAPGSSGMLTVGPLSAGFNVTLDTDGPIVASGPTVGVSLGGDYDATGLTIDPLLLQPTFSNGSSGSLSLTISQAGGTFDLTGHPLIAPGSITVNATNENLNIDSLTATAGLVSLFTSGAITQNAGSIITAQNLSVGASNGITLNSPNVVQVVSQLTNSSMGGISFTNQGDIDLSPSCYYCTVVDGIGQTVNLVSITGSITEQPIYYYYTEVYAGTLTASTVTGINLGYTNAINDIGPITNSTSGGISINDNTSLTLVGDVSAPGQTINFTISGGLNQTAGVITGALLNATADNGVTLNDANAITDLGTIINYDSGGISFTNGGDLVLTAGLGVADQSGIIANGQTVNLVSLNGAITQTSGIVDAMILTGSAANGFALNQANFVGYLGDISNTGSGGISFTNDGDLILAGDIQAAGQTVSLTALSNPTLGEGGAITQALGSVTAGTLNLTAVTGIDLSGPNAADQLGAVTTTSGDIAFNNAGDLVLSSSINAPGRMVSVRSDTGMLSEAAGVGITAADLRASAVTGLDLSGPNTIGSIDVLRNGAVGTIQYTSTGGISLTTDVYGFGAFVSLTAQSGSVTQQAGETLTAGVLSVSATGGIALGNANAVTDTLVIGGGGAVSLNDTTDLTMLDGLQAAGQSVSLTDAASIHQPAGTITAGGLTAAAAYGIGFADIGATPLGPITNSTSGDVILASSGNLQLTANVTAAGQNVYLAGSGGTIAQTGGVITGGALYVAAASGISLTGANQFNALGLAKTSTGAIAVTDTGDLALTGMVQANGQTISLASGGALTQTGGLIAAGTLDASATTGIMLTNGNLLANFGTISNASSGGVSILNVGDPNLTGNITAPGQIVNLTAVNGGFTQTGGVITAGVLNVTADAGITLNDANAVASIGSLSNSGTGGISFTNAGDFSLTGDVTATGQAVSLTSTGGSINQTAGSVTGQDISLYAGAGATLEAVVATDQATVTATTLSVTHQAYGNTTGLVAPNVIIESRSGLLDMGDNLNDTGFAGMALSDSTLTSISFDTISFYAGSFNPTARLTDLAPQQAIAIKVGDISGDFKGLDTPTNGLTAQLFAGPNSTIEVLGSVTSTSGLGNIVVGDATADAWTPKTIAISGSIGASGTTLAPLNSIELNATRDILIGDAQFMSAVGRALQSGQTSLIDINDNKPAGVMATGTQTFFIGADTLTLRAQGAIVSQNTGTGQSTMSPSMPTTPPTEPIPPADAGIDVLNPSAAATALVLGSTSTNRTQLIDIFGSLTDATGATLMGKDVAPSTAISLTRPLSTAPSYRINGCVIGEVGVCTVQMVPTKLIEGVILSTAAASDPQTETAQINRVYVQIPLVSTQANTTVGDPTITGVGNEEIWRGPACNPGDKSCQ